LNVDKEKRLRGGQKSTNAHNLEPRAIAWDIVAVVSHCAICF
jgi:hypothetical protein